MECRLFSGRSLSRCHHYENQDSIDKEGNKVVIEGKEDDDACVVPRAVPIVESMAAITILDYYLRNKRFIYNPMTCFKEYKPFIFH